jgi:hypothetical protein
MTSVTGRASRSMWPLMCGMMAVSRAAAAQPTFQIEPALAIVQTFDNNLLFAPADPQSDFVTRVTPGLTSRFRGQRIAFDAAYTLDAQRFADHQELTAVNGHRAVAAFRSTPTQRWQFATDASFTSTHFPGELNTETAFVVQRAAAHQFVVRPSATYQLGQTTRTVVEYSLIDDAVAGGLHASNQLVRLRLERQKSERSTVTFGYDAQRFDFEPGFVSLSQVVTIGAARAVSRDVRLVISGGPRLTDNRVGADLAASLQATLRSAALGVAFSQTQTVIVGVAGIADTQNVVANAEFDVWRQFRIRLAPGAFRITAGERHATGYRGTIELSRALTRTMSFIAAFQSNVQNGNIYPGTIRYPFDVISRQVVAVGFVLAAGDVVARDGRRTW